MAKLNKAEATSAAAKFAYGDETIKAMTLGEISKLDYQARRALARKIFNDQCYDVKINAIPNYRSAAMEAFVDAALNIWSRPEQALQNERKAWKRAISGTSLEEARKKLMDIVTSFNLRGAHISEYGRIELRRSEPGWSGDASLSWRFERTEYIGTVNPDDPKQRAGEYELLLEVSTSGSSWSLAKMQVIHKAQADLLELAHELAAVFERERVIWTYGIPEPVEPITNNEEAYRAAVEAEVKEQEAQ